MFAAGVGANLYTRETLGTNADTYLARFNQPLLVPQANESLITILHTNDTHSQIDPLPRGDAYAGRGGVARRATLINQVRKAQPASLLVDAGDACQGTPYFNLYKGEVEMKAMSALGYDAMTLGNHEFDNGVDPLVNALKFANFSVINSNYEIKGTPLESVVKPFITKQVGNVRVGIFGLGINLEGLNAPSSFRGVKYTDPVAAAQTVIKRLREQERCQFILCLSHLGYYPNSQTQIGDSQVAAQVDGIDFIVSGHTHTFMDAPVFIKNPSGKQTTIFQVGKSGIFLGRVDFLIKADAVAAVSGFRLESVVA